MKTALALALAALLGSAAEAAPLLALAKPPRRAKPKARAEKPAPAPEPAPAPVIPSEDPYNLFHMLAQPEPAPPRVKRRVLPRPPGPVPPRRVR